jgi:hypothetical protein
MVRALTESRIIIQINIFKVHEDLLLYSGKASIYKSLQRRRMAGDSFCGEDTQHRTRYSKIEIFNMSTATKQLPLEQILKE